MSTPKAHTYTPLASPSTPSSIPAFFAAFYQASDTYPTAGTPEQKSQAHENYTTFFTPSATLIMGSKTGIGHAEILEIRKAMWQLVERRLHTPVRIFGEGSSGKGDEGEGKEELMLYGTVAYTLKDGRRSEVDWAARVILVKNEEGEWKMSFYQVYLDTAAMQNAK